MSQERSLEWKTLLFISRFQFCILILTEQKTKISFEERTADMSNENNTICMVGPNWREHDIEYIILFLPVFYQIYCLFVLIQVLIRRRPLLYVVGLLIPSIFLMLVDVTSFYLPISSGTRITFKVSILLGYTLFRVNLADELPATVVNTPLIGSCTLV